MIAGIIGDIIGSVYEAHQWTRKDLELIQPLPVDKTTSIPNFKNMKWVRTNYGWTDDTLCSLGLYSAYINNADPAKTLQEMCLKFSSLDDSIGFGASFKEWLKNPVPYESYGNGAIMRIGFIPFLGLSLSEQLALGHEYTAISHNHKDSFQSVQDFIFLFHTLRQDLRHGDLSKSCLKSYLLNQQFSLTVEDMHNENRFELNALYTFCQAVQIVIESSNIEEVLRNTFYVGGDSDTLACIACNLASAIYSVPPEFMKLAELSLATAPELYELTVHFSENYWNEFQ
jgi:ADP-ribosylglycohydrolase